MTSQKIKMGSMLPATQAWFNLILDDSSIKKSLHASGNAASTRAHDPSSFALFSENVLSAREIIQVSRGLHPTTLQHMQILRNAARRCAATLERADPNLPPLGLPPDQLEAFFACLSYDEDMRVAGFYEKSLRAFAHATNSNIATDIAAANAAAAAAAAANLPAPAAQVFPPLIDLNAQPWLDFLTLCRSRDETLFEYFSTCDIHVMQILGGCVDDHYTTSLLQRISPPSSARADRSLQILSQIALDALTNSRVTAVSVFQDAATMARNAVSSDSIAATFEFMRLNAAILPPESTKILVIDLVRRVHVRLGWHDQTRPFYVLAGGAQDFSRDAFVTTVRMIEQEQDLYGRPVNPFPPDDLSHQLKSRRYAEPGPSPRGPPTAPPPPALRLSQPSLRTPSLPPGPPENTRHHIPGKSGYFLRNNVPRCFGCANIAKFYPLKNEWHTYDTCGAIKRNQAPVDRDHIPRKELLGTRVSRPAPTPRPRIVLRLTPVERPSLTGAGSWALRLAATTAPPALMRPRQTFAFLTQLLRMHFSTRVPPCLCLAATAPFPFSPVRPTLPLSPHVSLLYRFWARTIPNSTLRASQGMWTSFSSPHSDPPGPTQRR